MLRRIAWRVFDWTTELAVRLFEADCPGYTRLMCVLCGWSYLTRTELVPADDGLCVECTKTIRRYRQR